ncbi:hypothetical protein [Acetivibrio saccincola]|jgi:hypothetical protein|uniref:Uncharacterized protein n=1 Tax=Acetivibrio saccincola TaxID=1677857 RepID=A0A2K9E422_9FIRM|nr:hypothetical protein [Acetivibrio saccincola]AUG58472.1 hypothetical protein HVS_12995 [Acetivibrio saccincola]NLW28245.1 hypothetical protein [Acetivibrio saccincola]PQQ66327.1 hypothetical protein B9R14_05895 [Acetivibrio saccincola]HOA97613.1 hypothetical protein [Acetivibrio saccincola]
MNKKIVKITGIIFFVCISLITAWGCKSESANEKIDELSGYYWEANDGSLLCLEEDGSFKWYRYSNDRTDSYYSGTYTVYNGMEAVNYISTELAKYELTYDEQLEVIENYYDKTIDDYYCLILDNKEMIVDGKNIIDEVTQGGSTITPFYGFYHSESEALKLANMNTANYANFKRYYEEEEKE